MLTLEDLGNQQGFESLAPTSATGITATLLKPTTGKNAGKMVKSILLNVEDNPVRFRMDGSAATASSGMLLKADTYYTLTNYENAKNFSVIDVSSASAVTILPFF